MSDDSAPRVTRPGRFLCHVHRYVITTGMKGCPRCIADQTDPEVLPW